MASSAFTTYRYGHFNRTVRGPVEFACPACGHRLRSLPAFGGKPGRCPVCRIIFKIPRLNEVTLPLA